MKKFLAILLAAMLLLSMGAVAVAEEKSSTATTFTFKKIYNNAENTVFPKETLKFTVVAKKDYDNPDETMISIDDQTVSANNQDITVTVPSYSVVGKWMYTVTETAGNTQGVTYNSDSFEVTVIVVNDENGGLKVEYCGITSTKDDKKITTITNTYSVGSLNVKKTVSGNLASKTQEFNIDVTFTSSKPVLSDITYGNSQTILSSAWKESDGTYTAEATVQLKHDGTVTFSNIPVGVTYSVAEDGSHTQEDPNGSDSTKGYTVTYNQEGGTISSAESVVIVNNQKGIDSPETGITTDSLPYVMLLGFVLLAGAAIIIKRRLAH